ncbi:unnamed protein product, partial [Vitis vinifera]|uniref:Uncharacterized protein n=1 Tax=Vitis vinifera TaxID=29760 RepID=D7TI98_VITVI
MILQISCGQRQGFSVGDGTALSRCRSSEGDDVRWKNISPVAYMGRARQRQLNWLIFLLNSSPSPTWGGFRDSLSLSLWDIKA